MFLRTIGKAIAGCLLLLGSASLLGSQNSPLPKYRVIKGYPPRDNAAAINAAADQGYRLLFAYNFVVMRLEATPPDTYRYAPLPRSGEPASLNALNQQGALGYGWSERADILEKQPHPRNYEYRMPEGFTGKALDRSREALLDQGFQVVRDFGASAMLMHEIGSTLPGTHPKRVRLADALRKDNVMKNVSELAAQGYRYRSPALSKRGGGKAVAMEECDATFSGPFEYRSFDVKDGEQLERDLNALGHDGFRVAPKSLAWTPHLAEHSTRQSQVFVYRVIPASGDSTMEESLNELDRDGFIPLGVAYVGWNLRPYLVLEKATVSATP